MRLLGPISAARGDLAIPLGGPKQRAALALLASRPGQVVSADSLVEALWGEDPPATAATALQGHISKLRRLLGMEAIVTREPGYVLEADVDATRFAQLVQDGALRDALSLWHGRALADVANGSNALHALAKHLEELRLDAHEELFDAEFALGRHVDVLAELESYVRAEPLRERAVGQLMLALYRAGRQADALAAYRRFRQELDDRLGLEPPQTLRDLERQILTQDPALAPPAAPRQGQERRLPLTVAAVAIEPDETDPEAYAQAAGRTREQVRLVFERHGAAVERAGAAVVGLFSGHEDDAERALAAVAELGARAGIASGDSFAGESAAIERALRLLDNAAPVATDELTQSRARPRDLRLDRALAGRSAESRRLRELYSEPGSAVVTLVGPPGIGKSRLAEELAASVPARVLRARCLSYGDALDLLPAVELVRAAAALAADATEAEARATLERLLADEPRAGAVVDQVVRILGLADEAPDAAAWAMQRLLAAGPSPTLVLVDDLHWASPAFVEIVERIGTDVTFVVATSRDRRVGTAIQLEPLTRDACAEIAEAILGRRVDPETLDQLVARSGGNPLFLEELVHFMRASGQLDDTLPPSIRSLLAARIELLPERERDLLTRCSVLGGSFTLAEMRELTDDVDEPLAGLRAAGLLQPAPAVDDLAFRHLLIRDAAYASLPLGLRADLHERVAARFDAGGARENEALAVHHLDRAYRARATLGEPQDPRELAARMVALGRTALAHGDAAAASTLLARALELVPENTVATIELGRALYDTGDLAAADEAWSHVEHERAAVGRIEVRLHTDPDCDLEAAGAEIDELLAALRGLDDDGVVEALLARAYVLLTRGRIGELGSTLDEGLVVAHAAGRSRAEAEILFLVCGASWYGPLPVPLALKRCERVLADARDRPLVEAAALQSLGVLRAMAGDFHLARESAAAARAIKRDIGQELGSAASAMDVGLVELLAGDYDAAEAVFRDGQAQLERLGEKGYFSTLTALLAGAVEAQGRADEARELARASIAAAAPDDVASKVHARAAESRALARLGQSEQAKTIAREAVVFAEATDFTLLRADAWSALGDVATAVEILEQKQIAAAAIDAWARTPVSV